MIDYSKIEVALDNGHGSNTPGKRSVDGKLREYAWARELVKLIAEKLNRLGIKTFVVTPETYDVGLTVRANRVNKRILDNKKKGISTILISVHNNACGNGRQWTNATGWECWTTKGKTRSDLLAQCMCDAAKEVMPETKLRGHKEENWTILYKSNCPCVLTENLFMDNKKECEYLLSDEGKNKLADLHVKGVMNWCERN